MGSHPSTTSQPSSPATAPGPGLDKAAAALAIGPAGGALEARHRAEPPTPVDTSNSSSDTPKQFVEPLSDDEDLDDFGDEQEQLQERTEKSHAVRRRSQRRDLIGTLSSVSQRLTRTFSKSSAGSGSESTAKRLSITQRKDSDDSSSDGHEDEHSIFGNDASDRSVGGLPPRGSKHSLKVRSEENIHFSPGASTNLMHSMSTPKLGKYSNLSRDAITRGASGSGSPNVGRAHSPGSEPSPKSHPEGGGGGGGGIYLTGDGDDEQSVVSIRTESEPRRKGSLKDKFAAFSNMLAGKTGSGAGSGTGSGHLNDADDGTHLSGSEDRRSPGHLPGSGGSGGDAGGADSDLDGDGDDAARRKVRASSFNSGTEDNGERRKSRTALTGSFNSGTEDNGERRKSRGEGGGSFNSGAEDGDERRPRRNSNNGSFNTVGSDNESDASPGGRSSPHRRTGAGLKGALLSIGAVLSMVQTSSKAEDCYGPTNPILNPGMRWACKTLSKNTEARQLFIRFIRRRQWVQQLHMMQSKNVARFIAPDAVPFNKYMVASPARTISRSSPGMMGHGAGLNMDAKSSPGAPLSSGKRSSLPLNSTTPLTPTENTGRLRSKSMLDSEKQFQHDMLTLRNLKFKETSDPDLYAFHKPAGVVTRFEPLHLKSFAIAGLFQLFAETPEFKALHIPRPRNSNEMSGENSMHSTQSTQLSNSLNSSNNAAAITAAMAVVRQDSNASYSSFSSPGASSPSVKKNAISEATSRLRELFQSVASSTNETELDSLMLDGSWLFNCAYAVDELPFALSIVDMKGGRLVESSEGVPEGYPIVYVNRAYESTFQCPRAEAIGKGCMFMQHDELESDHVANIIAGVRAEQLVKVAVNSVRHGSASDFLNLLTFMPVFSAVSEAHVFEIAVHYEATKPESSMREINMIDDTLSVLSTIFRICT